MTSDAPGPTGPLVRGGRRSGDSQDSKEHQLLGSRLRQAREALGLTQADVAGALEIPRSGVAAFEAGERKVTGLELRRLARLYRRSVSWLLGEVDDVAVAADTALYRAAERLTPEDKEQVLRFVQFLAAAQPTSPAAPPLEARRRPRPPGARDG